MAALLLVLVLAEHGSFFSRFAGSGQAMAQLPGVTVGDTGDRWPVVTSVRSDGAAERAGIRVGDEIEAVDGRSVNNVATLRAVVGSDQGTRPLALHIRRGDALWTVAVDRSEPADDGLAATGIGNGAENPAY